MPSSPSAAEGRRIVYSDLGRGAPARKTNEFRNLIDLTFIGAMGPPGAGRPYLTGRYQRHYNLIFARASARARALWRVLPCLGANVWPSGLRVEKKEWYSIHHRSARNWPKRRCHDDRGSRRLLGQAARARRSGGMSAAPSVTSRWMRSCCHPRTPVLLLRGL